MYQKEALGGKDKNKYYIKIIKTDPLNKNKKQTGLNCEQTLNLFRILIFG